MCMFYDVGCQAKDVAAKAGDSFIDAIYAAITTAVSDTVAGLNTFWLAVKTPSLGSMNGGSYTNSAVVDFIQTNTRWYVGVLVLISVFITAGQMMYQRSGAPLKEGVASLVKMVLVTGAGLATATLLLEAGDGFSGWIISQALGGGQDFGAAMLALTAVGSGVAPMFGIIMGAISILCGIVQIGLLIIRGGLVLVLAGTLPLAWSATNTSWGKKWSQQQTGWLIAFILYKPVASLIYAIAFKLTSSSFTGDMGDSAGEAIIGVVTGTVLMFMAMLALPALMKFAVPAVGAAAAGGGAAGMFAAAGAGKLASGAVNSGKFGGKSSSASSGTPSGNSGGRGGLLTKSPVLAVAAAGAKLVKAGVNKTRSAASSQTEGSEDTNPSGNGKSSSSSSTPAPAPVPNEKSSSGASNGGSGGNGGGGNNPSGGNNPGKDSEQPSSGNNPSGGNGGSGGNNPSGGQNPSGTSTKPAHTGGTSTKPANTHSDNPQPQMNEGDVPSGSK